MTAPGPLSRPDRVPDGTAALIRYQVGIRGGDESDVRRIVNAIKGRPAAWRECGSKRKPVR